MALISAIRFFAAFQTGQTLSQDQGSTNRTTFLSTHIQIFIKFKMYRMSDYSLDVHRLYQLLCDNLVSNGHYRSVEFFFLNLRSIYVSSLGLLAHTKPHMGSKPTSLSFPNSIMASRLGGYSIFKMKCVLKTRLIGINLSFYWNKIQIVPF